MADNAAKQAQGAPLAPQGKPISIEKSIEALARYGGFDLLESAIENVQNVNPERKARRNIFLSEANKAKERET